MIDKLLATRPDAAELLAGRNEAELKSRRKELDEFERSISPKTKKSPRSIASIRKKAIIIKERQAIIAPAKKGAMQFHKNMTALSNWLQEYIKVNTKQRPFSTTETSREDPYGVLDTKVEVPAGSSTATMRVWRTGMGQGLDMEFPIKKQVVKELEYRYTSKIVDPGFLMPFEKGSRFDKMSTHSIKVDSDPRGWWDIRVDCSFPDRTKTWAATRKESGDKCKTPAVVDVKCLSAGSIGTVNAMECNESPVPEKVEKFYGVMNKLLDTFAGQIYGKIDDRIRKINATHEVEMRELNDRFAALYR